jgi:hypothetical protein
MKHQFRFMLSAMLLPLVTVAQKVDLDRFHADVSYQKLPQESVPFDKRTYGANVKTGGAIINYLSSAALYDKIYLHGWKKVEQSPTVGVEVNLEDFVERGASVDSRTVENKDKDGKVTSRTTYYFVTARYATRGYAKIFGPRTPVALTARELEAQKKKEEAMASNRFLRNASINTSGNDLNAPIMLGFSGETTHKTQEYQDRKLAMRDFENNKSSIYGNKLREFVDGAVYSVNNRVNEIYGYVPVKEKELFWILDAKSEEGATQIEAINAVKTLFATMRPDEPIDELKANMKPLIDYFDSLKSKYPADNKASRKMRYSSFYNLAKIYLLTDEPEKAMKEAQGLIANDYDARDGENLLESARQLAATFDRAQTRSRHHASFR